MQSKIRFEHSSSRSESDGWESLPVLLMVIALVIWFGFQLFQTLKARDNLITAFNNQEEQIKAANQIQASLSALATGTKQLANEGNPNAAQIVQALAKRGINISDPKPPSQESTKAGQSAGQPQVNQK